MTATTAAPQCPKCSGAMWDETKSRYYDPSKNKPIAKCRDKACDGVIWPPKNGAPAPAAAPANATIGLGPFDGEYRETGAPPAAVNVDRLGKLFTLYDVCLDHVLATAAPKLLKADIGTTPEAIAAMTATLYIAAKG